VAGSRAATYGLERGDLAFDIRHEGLGDFTRQLQRMVNRLALSILPGRNSSHSVVHSAEE
jgi:hypothetical protein